MKLYGYTFLTDRFGQLHNFYHSLGFSTDLLNNELQVIAGDAILNIGAVEGVCPFHHFAFSIRKGSLEGVIALLEKSHALLPNEEGGLVHVFEEWGARSCYLLDPAGNVVEFIERSEAEDGAFTQVADAVTGLAEVGVVAHNVLALANQFIEHCGLQFYPKQQPREDFAAIGDDYGLIIISAMGREWYPHTKKHGEKFPVKLAFEAQGETLTITL